MNDTSNRRGRPGGFAMADEHKDALSEAVKTSPAHQSANPARSKIQIAQIVPYWKRARRTNRTLAEVKAASPHAKRDDQLEALLTQQRCPLDGEPLTLTTTRSGDPEHGTAHCKNELKHHTFVWTIRGVKMEVEQN